MAKKIGVLEADQSPLESPRSHEKKSVVNGWIRRAEAVWIVKNRIAQKLKTVAARTRMLISLFYDGPLGCGNLLPFGDRRANPLIPPHAMHYEMPHAGDRGTFARHRRKRIRVSGRIQPEFRFAC
jgi:hypothetical protein